MLTIYLLYKTHINHKHKLLVETAVIIESTDKQENRMMLWALCFAAKNRISFRHLDNVDDTCSIRDIGLQVSLSTFTCSIYTVHKYFCLC